MNDISQNRTSQSALSEQPMGESQHHRNRRGASRGEQREIRWVAGAVLVILGVLFLAQTFGYPLSFVYNWWALFILLPTISVLGAALRAYEDAEGSLTQAVRGPLFGGILLLCVAGAFLFNLNLTLLGPILIILAGVAMLLNVVLPQ